MTAGGGDAASSARPQRRVPSATVAVAALLIAGGGTAVITGVLHQDAAPVAAPAATAPIAEPRTPVWTSPPLTSTPSVVATPDAPSASPLRISIPSIGVQSDLITVGLDANGALEVPAPGPTYDNAAWYDGSPRPGDAGASVIIGHVDSAEDGPSIFYRLGELAPGAMIDVRRADGTVASFVVDQVRGVAKDAFPTVEIYGHTADPQLRLITCGGAIGGDGHYVDNTVVFAHQV